MEQRESSKVPPRGRDFSQFEGTPGLVQEFDRLLNASYDGFAVVDHSGKVVWINRAYTRITGIPYEQIIGLTVDDLVSRGLLRRTIAGEVIRRRVSVTGTLRYPSGANALVTGTPTFDGHGRLALAVLNVRDVNELNKIGNAPHAGTYGSGAISPTAQVAHASGLLSMNLVIRCEQMRRCLEAAVRVGSFDCPVLLLGETGVGKSRFARVIHEASARSRHPFIQINCGAIPEGLIESELFGYEGGTFTGALAGGRVGQFELAQGGTVFLDEIGELSLNLQIKLLGVISDKRVRRLGGRNSLPLDVRVLAATNRNLESMVQDGTFRNDLYFRLSVFPLSIPPLREHPEEIAPLIDCLLRTINVKYGTNKRIEPDVIRVLERYNFPGNIRELENIMERMAVMADADAIELRHLHLAGFAQLPHPGGSEHVAGGLRQMLDTYEEHLLRQALDQSPTMREMAWRLGVSVPTLWRKLRRHGIYPVRPEL